MALLSGWPGSVHESEMNVCSLALGQNTPTSLETQSSYLASLLRPHYVFASPPERQQTAADDQRGGGSCSRFMLEVSGTTCSGGLYEDPLN